MAYGDGGFKGLCGGDRIEFWVREKAVKAKVQPLLVFEDHVVVNMGGRSGIPHVVDNSNFIRKVSA